MTGFLQLELLFLLWAAVYTLSTGTDCRANDESLQLIDNEGDFIFTSGCVHNAGVLEIFTVEYRGDNFFVDVKFLYQCFDHSNNVVEKENSIKTIFSMEGRTILLNSADYYYGITCSVWACFQDDSDEFMRLPQKNCSAFYVKDECASPSDNNCHHDASCSNLENDTFVCSCDVGYTGNGTHCEDIDECLTQPCNISADCTNSPPGSFSCSCMQGFTGDGISCYNINECSEDMSNCSHLENCRDTVGGYECDCIEGYQKNGFTCEDIDECSTGVHNCHINASCVDIPGSFNCSCDPGYRGNGSSCENIDECEEDLHNCTDLEYCMDILGSHECNCIKGYMKDGSNCRDIDECSTGVHNCHVNASCVDIPGSFNCSCDPGYRGSGTSCENIDECEEDIHNCTDLENCMDTLGSYKCDCNKGYMRVGDFCDGNYYGGTKTSLHLTGFFFFFIVIVVVVVVVVVVVYLVICVSTKYFGRKKRWYFIRHGGLLNITRSKSEIGVVVLDNLFEKVKEVVENDDISIVHELTFGKAKKEDAENQPTLPVETSDGSVCQTSHDHVVIDTDNNRSEVEETESAKHISVNYQESSVPDYIMENSDGSAAAVKPLNCMFLSPFDLDIELNSLDYLPEGSENVINSDYVKHELNEQTIYTSQV